MEKKSWIKQAQAAKYVSCNRRNENVQCQDERHRMANKFAKNTFQSKRTTLGTHKYWTLIECCNSRD